MTGEPRLLPQPPSEWSEEARRVFARATNPLAVLRTLAHQPGLLAPFLGWAAALAGRGALPRRASELLALRVALRSRSSYEWGHHVEYARQAGLSDEEITRVACGPDAAGWTESERALLVAADELHAEQQLSDASWRSLRAHFHAAQLVEIPLLIGHYTMLSMLTNATGVPLEPGLPPLPPTAPR